MKYLPFELHNHTRHSDGRFLTGELLRSCAAYGYRGAALTDQNVFTAVGEVSPELLAETGMIVIPGIEWTTFYGHLLVLGCKRYVDWRFVTPDTIDHALMEIREAGGIAGIAHPCEVGAPLMCGCHWDFKVTRWDLVSYVEVWSEENPHKRTKNALALPWYDALLNAGHRLWKGLARRRFGPVKSAASDGDLSGDGIGGHRRRDGRASGRAQSRYPGACPRIFGEARGQNLRPGGERPGGRDFRRRGA